MCRLEKILPDLSYDLCVIGDYRGDEISGSPEPDPDEEVVANNPLH